MGGWGSGKYYRHGARTTTDDLQRVDVRELLERSLIAPGDAEAVISPEIRPIPIEWSDHGATRGLRPRPWFVCPGCLKCRQHLYLDFDELLLDEVGPRLLCRVCLGLAYPSQRMNEVLRAKRRTEKAGAKLVVVVGPNGEALKPKGMHHATVVRLGHEYLAAYREHVALFNAKWGRIPTSGNQGER